MIPKKIHYCWFGKNIIPESVLRCVQSWKKYCPDYEIKLWTEDNFDVNAHPYMKEAYEVKKWAFVSDLARLLIIYKEGGIYLDTDVELIKSLDEVRDNSFFFAIERNSSPITGEDSIHVATGLGFGSEKGNSVLKSLIDEYNECHFILNDGKYDIMPCPHRNTWALEKYGYNGQNEIFRFEGGVIYPSEFFCPMIFSTKQLYVTNNTISIHHYDSSWKSGKDKFLDGIKNRVKRIMLKLGLHNS